MDNESKSNEGYIPSSPLSGGVNDVSSSSSTSSTSSTTIPTVTNTADTPSSSSSSFSIPDEYTELSSNLVKDADKVLTNLRNWNQLRRNSLLVSSSSSSIPSTATTTSSIHEYSQHYNDNGDILFSTSVENIHQAERTIKRYQQTTETLRSIESMNHSNNILFTVPTSITKEQGQDHEDRIATLHTMDVNIAQLQNDTVALTAKMLTQAKLLELGLSDADILDAQVDRV